MLPVSLVHTVTFWTGHFCRSVAIYNLSRCAGTTLTSSALRWPPSTGSSASRAPSPSRRAGTAAPHLIKLGGAKSWLVNLTGTCPCCCISEVAYSNYKKKLTALCSILFIKSWNGLGWKQNWRSSSSKATTNVRNVTHQTMLLCPEIHFIVAFFNILTFKVDSDFTYIYLHCFIILILLPWQPLLYLALVQAGSYHWVVWNGCVKHKHIRIFQNQPPPKSKKKMQFQNTAFARGHLC